MIMTGELDHVDTGIGTPPTPFGLVLNSSVDGQEGRLKMFGSGGSMFFPFFLFRFFDFVSMGISSLAVVLYCPLLFLLLLSEDFAIDWRYKELQRLFISSVGSDCLKEV